MQSGAMRIFPAADDELRILALGRVPRCVRCARLRALADGAGRGQRDELPDVPSGCAYQLCAPLVSRYEEAREVFAERERRAV